MLAHMMKPFPDTPLKSISLNSYSLGRQSMPFYLTCVLCSALFSISVKTKTDPAQGMCCNLLLRDLPLPFNHLNAFIIKELTLTFISFLPACLCLQLCTETKQTYCWSSHLHNQISLWYYHVFNDRAAPSPTSQGFLAASFSHSAAHFTNGLVHTCCF